MKVSKIEIKLQFSYVVPEQYEHLTAADNHLQCYFVKEQEYYIALSHTFGVNKKNTLLIRIKKKRWHLAYKTIFNKSSHLAVLLPPLVWNPCWQPKHWEAAHSCTALAWNFHYNSLRIVKWLFEFIFLSNRISTNTIVHNTTILMKTYLTGKNID